ncbi:type II toxin-antitoxin system Phd/YefM family antitoxin [Leifsonia xyli]|uniref:type II toxin-antitoxin system Phd/YefM family antitoxin n=1 Tax=Leifsonia xyli TaxID=1575 RepID=UPI003D6651A6
MIETAPSPHSITVGQLRQNPTPMLDKVQDGETYIITSHGRAIADVVPHEGSGWVPADRVRALLAVPGDLGWAEEIRQQRDGADLRDPWA